MSDVFLDGVTDLFGDPIPKSRGKRGRPPHVPTAENRRFVQLALVCGHDEPAIAQALGITEKTLGRHYFHELSGRRSARLRMDMKNLSLIVEQADKGSVSAMSLLEKKLERMRLREMSDARAGHAPASNKPKPAGKKAAAQAAAAGVTGRFAPPPAPGTLLN